MRSRVSAISRFHTLRWLDAGGFEILDQRALPNAERYLRLRTAAEAADAIRSLAVRGAPAIGCAAAFGLAVEAGRLAHLSRPDFAQALEDATGLLAASRPTAVNLFWALDRLNQVRRSRLDAAPAAIAGALATAGHGTALGIIRSAVGLGKRVHVYADETRPVLQGARLTAWELTRDGIPVTILPDGASGHLMSRVRIDLVIVGADRVAANGDVANKIGTYNLAVLAHRHGIPFYVACPLSSFDLEIPTGAAIPIEERDPEEVRGHGGVQWAPDTASVFNPAFDVTPAGLITAIITERGVTPGPDPDKILRLFATAL